jgi:hypothetical protein
MLLMISGSARAKPVVLKDDPAESFIKRHFPDADIPGLVEGAFAYVDKSGRRRKGHAKCYWPAMGARSEGAVSTGTVTY